ncbi:MAG: hypothetical protein AB7O24_21765 [Kofleriaceae bacterium]
MRIAMTLSWVGVTLVVSACTNSPVYIPGPATLMAGMDDGMGTIAEGRATLTLPIKLETMADAADRAELAAQLAPIQVPYVRVGDIEVSVEWTIHNLAAEPGEAMLQLNGANEYWAYDPTMIMLSDDDDAPPAPGLQGDIPLHIDGNGSLDGLFREDEVREASIDLDQITRGNVNPFRAVLTISKNAPSFSELTPPMPDVEDYMQTPTGVEFPRAAFAQMLRIDIVFRADRPMTLDYNVRIRDVRGIIGDELQNTPVAELQYDPATFMPPFYAP